MAETEGQPTRQQHIAAEQVAQLYRLAPVGLIATVGNGSLVAFVLWGVVPAHRILLWYGSLLALTLLRYLLFRSFFHRAVPPAETPRWRKGFIAGMGLSGVLWGAAALVLFSEGSTAYQVFLAFVLGGMAAGAAATYATVQAAFLAYAVPTLVPLAVRFFSFGDEFHTAMGAMTLLFGVLLSFTARHNSGIYRTSLALRYDKDDLLRFLTQAKTEAEEVNGRLQHEIAERRHAQEELLRHRDTLEQRVNERTKALMVTNSRLQAESEELARASRLLRESEERYRAIVENTGTAIMISEDDTTISYINAEFEKLSGYSRDEVVGKKSWTEFASGDDLERMKTYHSLRREAREGAASRSYEFRFIDRSGAGKDVLVTVTVMPGTKRSVASLLDITERKRAQETVAYQARHDLLTGMANKPLFMERLTAELLQARRRTTQVAVLFLDLDRFKNINDSLGHEAGDELLKEVARRLRLRLRESDTIARIGGDEFAVALPDIPGEGGCIKVAEELLLALDQPYRITGHELHITASIGVSMFPVDSEYAESLLTFAHIAMRHAKEEGRNNYQFYNPALNMRTLERMLLENSLRQTLRRGELEVYYQPQFSLEDRSILCMEALVRWRHPELGLLTPLQFLPLAEEAGLINAIDEWVLRTACAQVKRWQKEGRTPLCVTVNLSARQFRQPNLVAVVSAALREAELSPEYLEIEVTEGVAMKNLDTTIHSLSRLSAMGVGISIDDFGTGYSSLSYLKRLPIQKLKIDKSFIEGLADDADDRAIVQAVIGMAHSLKLQVIAEGVETEEQLSFLTSSRCDAVQGYLFSRPLPVEHVEELLLLRPS